MKNLHDDVPNDFPQFPLAVGLLHEKSFQVFRWWGRTNIQGVLCSRAFAYHAMLVGDAEQNEVD